VNLKYLEGVLSFEVKTYPHCWGKEKEDVVYMLYLRIEFKKGPKSRGFPRGGGRVAPPPPPKLFWHSVKFCKIGQNLAKFLISAENLA
jgi:hypothetical protein